MVEQSSEVHISRPDTSVADRLAQVLADVTCVEYVAADSHFFDDLGANSLVMAQFCARVRKIPDLPSASMKDIYRYPTIQSLAEALAEASDAARDVPAPLMSSMAQQPPPEPPTMPSRLGHALCGTFQLLVFLAYSFVFGVVTTRGYGWIADAPGVLPTYQRAVVFGGIGFVVLCAFPIAAKWILIGRWKPGEFPLWGPAYLRFWLVKVLLHGNPMVFLVGNPLYNMYLRALGARIGKGVTILSRSVPVCTDLFTVGAGTVIRKDSFFLCYRAHAGRIQTGRVTLGRDVFIGEKTVLDIDTAMGDGAQLGHSSALHRGQTLSDGEHRHGSPAEPTDIEHIRVAPVAYGTLRRTWYGLATLIQLFFGYIPLAIGGLYMLFRQVPALGSRIGPDAVSPSAGALVADSLAVSFAVFFGFLVFGLLALCTLPRLAKLVIKPDRAYPLYGFRYAVHQATVRMTNVKFFPWLFGDSSYIVYFLRGLGYDLSKVEQTGSNFGTEVQHESPYLVSVGSGTMVADGLSIVNADYSSTSFQVSRVTIGRSNFLGNNIAYPVGGRTGENCLLATKVMIPLDGEIRQGVGLLGSPCFEIPRTVERDTRFDDLRSGDTLHNRLAAKNRYNLRSMALMLFARWLYVFAITLFGLATVDLYGVLGHVVIAGYLAFTLLFSALYYVLLERCITSFRALRPKLCSIYDPYFWWHERLWKVPDRHLAVFNGTPFKSLIWRLLGVRVGRMVFDDGCYLTERTLATIGDGCTLNAGSKIQCHSQEDGTFKSDVSVLGAGCTLGVGSHVHYGVTMGDGAVLAADSFLMKGEEVPSYARWGGNPAVDMPNASEQLGASGPAKTLSAPDSATATVS